MAERLFTVQDKVLIARAAQDRSVNRTRLAAALGISRQWLTRLIDRFRRDEFAGLEPRSRAPKQPAQLSPVIEDAVVRLRKDLAEAGLDHGPATIRWHLEQLHVEPLPSQATIWRICQRHGMVIPAPKKRPRASWQRFVFASPNECWQIDCTRWRLGSGAPVVIVNVLDDHSRVCVASRAVNTASCEAAWNAICVAAEGWGLPAMVLSDNGTEFTGALFVANLHRLGITTVTSRPRHPQTCGKVERFHQTLKKWLARQPRARTVQHLQRQLDRFVRIYNHERPHRAIGRRTPAQQWRLTAPATPGTPRLDVDQRVVRSTAGDSGAVLVRPWRIALGRQHANRPVTVIIDDLDVNVFTRDGAHIHSLHIDPTRRYQRLTNT
jgi:transposase InsO family protein